MSNGMAREAQGVSERKPSPENSATAKSLLVEDERQLLREQERLSGLTSLRLAGRRGVRKSAYFFEKMTPEGWAILMYKDFDHLLRQFGV